MIESSLLELVTVHKISASAEPDMYLVDLTMKIQGVPERTMFYLRRNDPYGLSPMVVKWMDENPHTIEPWKG